MHIDMPIAGSIQIDKILPQLLEYIVQSAIYVSWKLLSENSVKLINARIKPGSGNIITINDL